CALKKPKLNIKSLRLRSAELSDKFGKEGKVYTRGFKLWGNDMEIMIQYLDSIQNIDQRRVIK
ncbi:MAG TPA: hypothetical protein VLB01_03560, partial [Thermodesulfobacteriota bacterium]|nr:hypothetical protein [Thermodesulfobacteriota bacterium]